MKTTLALILAALVAAPAGAERFDRSAHLPDLLKAVKIAQQELKAYREAQSRVGAAARSLRADLPGVPKSRKKEEYAKQLVVLEESMRQVEGHLEAFHGAMSGIADKIEHNLIASMGRGQEELGRLMEQFSASHEEHERTAQALVELARMDASALSEADARRLERILAQQKLEKAALGKLAGGKSRIGGMRELVAQKLEWIKTAVGMVEARLIEVRSEILVVQALKEVDIVDSLIEAVFGAAGAAGTLDLDKMFDNEVGDALDELLREKPARPGPALRRVEEYLRETAPAGR